MMECSDIISRSLDFSSPFSHFKDTQSSVQNFPINQRRTDGVFNFKVCSVAVILVLLMLF